MISIFFKKISQYVKDVIFYENMVENFLGFSRMHENKIFFFFFVFERGN